MDPEAKVAPFGIVPYDSGVGSDAPQVITYIQSDGAGTAIAKSLDGVPLDGPESR